MHSCCEMCKQGQSDIGQICPFARVSECIITQIAKFMGPTWGPHGSCQPQMGPMLVLWTLLSGYLWWPYPWGIINVEQVYAVGTRWCRRTSQKWTQINNVAFPITSKMSDCSTACSEWQQRNKNNPPCLWLPHKRPVIWKEFLYHEVIMTSN